MKKLLLLLLLSLSLTACEPPVDERPAARISPTDPTPIFEVDTSTCETREADLANCYFQVAKDQKDFTICQEAPTLEDQDTCLYNYGIQMAYYDAWPIDLQACAAHSNPDPCYELLAIKLREPSICESTAQPQMCLNQLHYRGPNSDWKLVLHWSDTADTRLVYEGLATLRGWLGEGDIFYIMRESFSNLPDDSHDNFLLKNINDEQRSQLQGHTSQDPITITVNQFETLSEGRPSLKLDSSTPEA